MADLDDRSAALHAEDRHVAPERRQSVPGLRGLRRSNARRAQPISQSTQSAGWPPQAHRVPHRSSNAGDPCRVHRADSEISEKPDAADPALRHRGSRGRDHRPDPAGSLPDRARAHPAYRQGQQDPRRAPHRQDHRRTCTSTSTSSTRTSPNSPRPGRCSTVCTAGDLPNCPPTRSPPCSSKPPNPHVLNALRSRRTSTAT